MPGPSRLPDPIERRSQREEWKEVEISPPKSYSCFTPSKVHDLLAAIRLRLVRYNKKTTDEQHKGDEAHARD